MSDPRSLSIKQIFSLSVLVFVLFLLASFISAWSNPTATAPGGNVPAPLNVGLTGQIKQGGLVLNASGGALNGLIVHGGNVGIGNDNPSHKLSVNGNVWINGQIAIADGSQGAGKVLTSDTSGIASWQTPSGGTIWGISGSNIYNTNTGNVGIGMTNPGTKLEVAGGIKPGNVTTGTTCSPEGAFGYDSTAHAPVYCSSGLVWSGMTDVAGTVCGSRIVEVLHGVNYDWAWYGQRSENVPCHGNVLTVSWSITQTTVQGCPAGYRGTFQNVGNGVMNIFCIKN